MRFKHVSLTSAAVDILTVAMVDVSVSPATPVEDVILPSTVVVEWLPLAN